MQKPVRTEQEGWGMRIRIKVCPLLYLGFTAPPEHVKNMNCLCLAAAVPIHPHPSIVLMATTRFRCQGCNRIFTHDGLSQHLTKTQHPMCRAASAVLQTPTILQPFPNVGPPPASDTNPASQDTSPVSGVQQLSGEIASADEDEGKVFQCHAEFSTNVYVSDDIMNGHEDGIDGDPDADDANTLDADAFEILTGSVTASTAAIPDEVPPIEPAEPTRPLPDPLIQVEEANSEPIAELSITRFTYGSPGAPIPGPVQGSAMYVSNQAAPSSLDWAPFSSELDWEIARWAKIRGPTSSALTELLAIPGVCGPCLALNGSLTCHVRSSKDSASHTRQQTS